MTTTMTPVEGRPEDEKSGRPILIVDLMNAFIRAFCAYPTMSSLGYQMGGCIGTLKTMRRLVDEINPSAVYVAWEGGGSQRRRSIYPEYKLNRKPGRLNRFYGDDIPDSEENKQHQLVALIGMMKHVPACQLYVSDCEGDDVVAWLCCGPFKGRKKIIVSSDKDMYQLLDPVTSIYNLHRKTYVTLDNVFDEYRITSRNFSIAKALCGDPSDNIPGIKGLGWKKVVKLYPFLGTDRDVLLQDVIDYANSHADESAIHRRVTEQKDIVERNFRLVHLNGNMMSAEQVSKVTNQLSTYKPRANKMGLVRCLVKEGVGDFDVDGFFYAFNAIEGIEYVR